jgi:LmbE family N-acetylglucosaminyl deacetylase
MIRPGHTLPTWRSVLVVVAHPDDETFGLGAVIDTMTSAGSAVHVLCFTRGEASTLNERNADLSAARAEELRQASAELAVASVTLLDYPDGGLAADPIPDLEAHVISLAARHRADGLLVFDDTGIAGHRDHQAATAAAVRGQANGPDGACLGTSRCHAASACARDQRPCRRRLGWPTVITGIAPARASRERGGGHGGQAGAGDRG